MTLPDLATLRRIEFPERRKLDMDEFKLRSARESDIDEVVREPFLLYEGDRLLLAYFHLADDEYAKPGLDQLWRTLPHIRYATAYRAQGLRSTSRTFGYLPRVTMRRDFCTATSMAQQQPKEHAVVAAAARAIAGYYELANPELFNKHLAEADRVLEDYKIEGGPFTSGIVNHNNPLRYHHDRGNFRNVWSAMLGFRRYIGGGYLALPEFGIAAEIADRSLLMFDGQGILHGVTPIRRLRPDAERFTVVYYSMKFMWNCDPVGAEIDRIRAKKTTREYKRAGRTPATPVAQR